MNSLFWSIAGNLLGQLAHFLKQIVVAHQSGNKVSLCRYWIDHWPESMLSLCFSMAGQFLLFEQGVVSFSSGFACGFAADSMSDVWGNRARTIISREKDS